MAPMRRWSGQVAVGLTTLGLAALATPATAQIDVAQYGTRAPVQCGPFQTFNGSAAAATQIWQCEYERDALQTVASTLYLLEDISLQVGAARPYAVARDYTLVEPDETTRVYPLRGTWTVVQCGVIHDWQPLYNVGSNCNEYYKRGEGACYRTQFGDWRCVLNGSDIRPAAMRIAPRGGGGLTSQPGALAEPPPQTPPQPVGQPPVPPDAPPAASTPATGTAPGPTGGRRVARDPNRPIGTNETVIYEDPNLPGQPQRCTVLAVYVGAYRVQCLRSPGRGQFIARDLDVRRETGTAPEQSAAAAPTGPPFRAGDIILATPMGLQDEASWQLCVVIANNVQAANAYAVDCGYGPRSVLPDWVRADPEFQ